MAGISSIQPKVSMEAITRLKGIIGYADEPLVSADYNHNPFSAVYDATGTMVIGKRLCTVMAWYDNELAFSLRMLDTGAAMAKLCMNW
jgi:glyceraldehyde 3-phosphate dehydrogenase